MARRRRRRYDDYSEFPIYVSVGEKRAKAEKSLEKLRKKNPGVKPVVIAGSAIASSWWGKSWNKNLEGYADYSNRIGRGRSYVRSGAVLDLQIGPGEVAALVQGSRSRPYSVVIKITGITPAAWENLKKACAGENPLSRKKQASQKPPGNRNPIGFLKPNPPKQAPIAQAAGDRWALRVVYGHRALIYRMQGKLEAALKFHKKEENICEELGDRACLARTWRNQRVIYNKKRSAFPSIIPIVSAAN